MGQKLHPNGKEDERVGFVLQSVSGRENKISCIYTNRSPLVQSWSVALMGEASWPIESKGEVHSG